MAAPSGVVACVNYLQMGRRNPAPVAILHAQDLCGELPGSGTSPHGRVASGLACQQSARTHLHDAVGVPGGGGLVRDEQHGAAGAGKLDEVLKDD